MVRFSPEVWRSRASARHSRASAAGRLNADAQYWKDLTAIEGLERIVAWCESKQHVVAFVAEYAAEYFPETRTFQVNGRSRPETQLYLLLHECGHYLIGFPQRGKRFSEGYPTYAEPGAQRKLVYRIDVLDEEMEAWHRGRRLAGRLGVRVDKAAFDRIRTECIKNYAKWALRVDSGGVDGEE